MSTLFPNTFPRFLSVWGPDDYVPVTQESYSGSVREKLTEAAHGTPANSEEYRRINKFFESVNFLPLAIENEAGKNLIVGHDGYIKYVDRVFTYDSIKDLHIEKVAAYMDREQVRDKVFHQLRPYTQREKDMVHKALIKLQEIQRQGRSASGALEELYRIGKQAKESGEACEIKQMRKEMRLVSNRGWKARVEEVPQNGQKLMWWGLYYAPLSQLSGITIGNTHFDITFQEGQYVLHNRKTEDIFPLQNGRGWQVGNFSNEKYGNKFTLPRIKIEGEGTDDLQTAFVIYKDELIITDTASEQPTVVQRKKD